MKKLMMVPMMALLLSVVLSSCYSRRYDPYYQNRNYSYQYKHRHHHDRDRDRDRDHDRDRDDSYGYRRY